MEIPMSKIGDIILILITVPIVVLIYCLVGYLLYVLFTPVKVSKIKKVLDEQRKFK